MLLKNPPIPPSEFFQRVKYDPVTGVFSWKNRDLSDFKNRGSWISWNAQHAGKEVKTRGYGYVCVCLQLNGVRYVVRGHQLARAFITGEWPIEYVDHENRSRADNRQSNLRMASSHQNNCNTSKRSGTTSQYKGVSYNAHAGYWAAAIDVNRKRTYLGLYQTEEEAAAVYDLEAIKLHGEFASLNGVTLAYEPVRMSYRVGSSGMPGVHPHPQQKGKFIARVKKKYLGLFPSLELAAEARARHLQE